MKDISSNSHLSSLDNSEFATLGNHQIQKESSCWIFPGQGSQYADMASMLLNTYPEYTYFFEKAEYLLGLPLRKYIEEGGGEFQKTSIVQPAIYTLSCIMARIILDQGAQPAFVAGHSLGEYAAMFVAGVFAFEDGLAILQKRGQFMNDVCEKVPSGMVACLFKADPTDTQGAKAIEKCTQLAAESSNDEYYCSVANHNTPTQIVISGHDKALEKAQANAANFGIRKTIRLNTAGAYHSSIMKPASDELRYFLDTGITLNPPKYPILWNVTGSEHLDSIKTGIIEQIYSQVQWHKIISDLLDRRCKIFYEIGPGGVLSKMLKSVAGEDIEAHTLDIKNT